MSEIIEPNVVSSEKPNVDGYGEGDEYTRQNKFPIEKMCIKIGDSRG